MTAPTFDHVVPTRVSGFQPYDRVPLFLLVAIPLAVVTSYLIEQSARFHSWSGFVAGTAIALGALALILGLVYFVVRPAMYPRQIAVSSRGLTIWGLGHPITTQWEFLLPPRALRGSWVGLPTAPKTPGYRGVVIPLTLEQAKTVVEAPYHPPWSLP